MCLRLEYKWLLVYVDVTVCTSSDHRVNCNHGFIFFPFRDTLPLSYLLSNWLPLCENIDTIAAS